MKKITLLLSAILLIVAISNAQISKGTIWLGGSIGYGNSKQGEQNFKQRNINISPAVGVAVEENTIMGIQLNFSKSKFESSTGSQESHAYGADLFLRRYWQIVNRLSAYGHFRAGYASTKEENKSPNYSREVPGWSIGLGATPGIAFSINKKFQLEAGFNNLLYINYNKSKSHVVNAGMSSYFENENFSGGLNFDNASSLQIGVRFLIGN